MFFESFQLKSVNMGFWVQISNLNQILPVRYFECADFRPEIRFPWFLATGYTNQFNDFVLKRIWKTFFFAFCFGKVSKCYGLNCYFLKVLIVNIRKKCKLILSHNNFKISRNRMNGKADFEIILKRCKHMKHVTAWTISIITISMVTNQNLFIMFMPINKYLLRYF